MEGGLAAEGDGVEAVAEGGEAQRIVMRLQRGCEVAAHGVALRLVEPNRKRTTGPCGTGVCPYGCDSLFVGQTRGLSLRCSFYPKSPPPLEGCRMGLSLRRREGRFRVDSIVLSVV